MRRKEKGHMKRLLSGEVSVLLISILLLVIPAIVHAQSAPQPAPPPPAAQMERTRPGPPPIAPPIVREGDFALKLVNALGLGTAGDEVEAETRLGDSGIVPRNGWIADYPVTPDIIAELQKSVGDAADGRKIGMTKDEALNRLNNVSTDLSMAITTNPGSNTSEPLPEEAQNYPDPTVINNYYTTEGPPVVSYYAPPPDYYYLYSWLPSPFWWNSFWFPGFFILNDFHRPFFFGHHWGFVSNHFNDVRNHRVYRVDPAGRFRGRTFAGIGVTNRRGFISTGVAHGERRVFNASRTRGGPEGRTFGQPFHGSRAAGVTNRGVRSFAPSAHSGVRSGGGGRMSAPSGGVRSGGGGRIGAPSGGVRSGGGGRIGVPSGGGRSGGGGGHGGERR
jgi:hypothetical protein